MFGSTPFTLRTFLMIAAGALLLFTLSIYVIFQARFLIIGPQIVLRETPAPVQSARVVTLTGTAFNIARLWLNDRPIFTNPQGEFEEALVLENGYTVATLRAEDRYGRTTTAELPFTYVPASIIP